jgi:hypothetical protein
VSCERAGRGTSQVRTTLKEAMAIEHGKPAVGKSGVLYSYHFIRPQAYLGNVGLVSFTGLRSVPFLKFLKHLYWPRWWDLTIMMWWSRDSALTGWMQEEG